MNIRPRQLTALLISLTKMTLPLMALILFSACHSVERWHHDQWDVMLTSEGIQLQYARQHLFENVTAELQTPQGLYATQDYGKPAVKVRRGGKQKRNSLELTFTYEMPERPTLIHKLELHEGYLLTQLLATDPKGLEASQMIPWKGKPSERLESPEVRRTFVPFDNDAWVRYSATADDSASLRSYEVTCYYRPQQGDGLVIGALQHDRWKNAIDMLPAQGQVSAISGVADQLTRDVLPHSHLKGDTVSSAIFSLIPHEDWREAMDEYARQNTLFAPRRRWDHAMPVGWNSWGALAFDVNPQNATEVARYLHDELQPRHFGTADGTVYTGLDSGWDSFGTEKLKAWAQTCKSLGQVPCIYWTPFTDWGKDGNRQVPHAPEYTYADIWLRAHGEPQELDGAYAIDPTHPAVRKMMEEVARLFRECGFRYVKMDFMTHGRMEADRWADPTVQTGTEAYNYGMHLLDSIFSDMYLNLSISPLFPAQYAQSRRIACDAWNKIKDTEYTMNALTWGWWLDKVYHYNDGDHIVLRDATEGENRARVTSSVITGLYILGDDFSQSGRPEVKQKAMKFLTNPDINALATGVSFRPLTADTESAEHIFVRKEEDGLVHVAVFNYDTQPSTLVFPWDKLSLEAGNCVAEELWSHQRVDLTKPLQIAPCDVKVFRIQAQN